MSDKMHSFTDKEKAKIHDASAGILNKVGVVFQDEGALAVFKKHGFKVDGQKVFITEPQIQKALETVPETFEITARNPEKSVMVGEGYRVCVPGYGAPFIMTETGQRRKGTMEDYINFCKLVHTSEQIDMTGYEMIEPSDVSGAHAYLYMMQANMIYGDKPFMGASIPNQAAKDAIEMAGILWGDKGHIHDKHVILPTINPLSPLMWDDNMSAAIVIYAENNQPIMFENLVMSGSTGPVSLTGTIALQNAEILSGLVLAQLIKPGLPVIFGCLAGVTDMKTGNLSIGAPEGSMFVSATAQMAQYYGVPGRSGGNLTDSHTPDMQAGIESAICLYTAMRSGITFLLHSCGILGAYLSMSYEKFIIDEEIIAMVKRMMEPIVVSDTTIDLETITEVGIGGEYLTHPKTFEQFRNGHFQPHLLSRLGYNEWVKNGSKDLPQRAFDTVKKRLESYEKPDIDSMTEKQLNHFVQNRTK
ncbi:MAG: trimethylamine methyltransferase family protein [Desulfobacula sp.]|jgi:trimethylamine--corrinoid protein Co-methyltransferase|nr:trimethylamine methyltransferase family protein [Desulfobacula sp.]